MRILALETSLVLGSIAAQDAGRLVAQVTLDPAVRTARSLAPGIQQLLRDVGWKPGDVQCIATTIGPGSFTGVRVGLATAKALAYAWNVPVVGIDTLAAIAAQAPRDAATIHAAVDAQRKQLFVEAFRRDASDTLASQGPPTIVDDAAWLETLARLDGATQVTGPGLARIQSRLPANVALVEPTLWNPTAATVAALAWQEIQARRTTNWQELNPLYIRPSAAEEVKNQRDAAGGSNC